MSCVFKSFEEGQYKGLYTWNVCTSRYETLDGAKQLYGILKEHIYILVSNIEYRGGKNGGSLTPVTKELLRKETI